MKRLMKVAAGAAVAAMCVAGLSACGSQTASEDKGQVYYLNSKPEVVDQFQTLAEEYTDEPGVEVIVETATTDGYESSLTSELGKSNAPTMFNISGYPTFAKVKDYLAPLQDTEVYSLLTDTGKSASMTEGEDSFTLPFVSEYSGIIYNKKIVKDYCSKDYAVIDSVDDITDFDTLKKVVESIQEHKDDLGLDAAWASPGLDSSGSYRFGDHMARVPVSAEFRDDNTTFAPEITGKYIDQFKDMFDLQVANSPTDATMLSSVTIDDVSSEFALGRVAFFNCGTWIYTQIKDNDVADEDIGMLPYWMGIPGEEDYSVVSVNEVQWGVNKNASDKDKQATLDFIKWMVSSDRGKEVLSKEMGFAVPFTTFGENDKPDNPITLAAEAYGEEGKKYIYNVNVPNQQYKDDINNALVEYVQGTGDWSTVKSAFVDGWKTEWANNKAALGTLPEAVALS